MRKVENPSAKTLYARKWRGDNQRQCVDCGTPCSFNAIRCHSCTAILFNASRKRAYFCNDCGVRVSGKRPLRCKPCARKRQCGENHPNWKGGRHTSSVGYVLVWKPNHPRASKNLVLEHILVLEEKLGRPLLPNEIGHHLNGIKNDNRPKNLVALTSKKHYLVLDAKAKRIQELEALLNNQGQLV